MGKSSKPSTPAAPDYEALARQQAELSKINEVGPNGSVTWNGQTRTTSLAPGQQALYDQRTQNQQAVGAYGSSLINGLSSDSDARSRVADALYKQSTKYFDTNFGNQENSLRTQLINSGLDENSEAYKRSMGEFNQRRDTAYGDAATTASLQGEQQSQANQSNAVNRLMSLLNYSGGVQTPQATTAYENPNLLGAASSGYQASVNGANATAASNSSANKGLGSALGGIGGFMLGGSAGAGIGSSIGSGLFSIF